jgi:hypothetical protein
MPPALAVAEAEAVVAVADAAETLNGLRADITAAHAAFDDHERQRRDLVGFQKSA